MQKFLIHLARGLVFSFIIIVVGSYVIVAQSDVTGEWNAGIREKSPDKIHISFERRSERGGKNQNSSNYSFDELRGLSRGQTRGGKVRFSLVHEAGTIEC